MSYEVLGAYASQIIHCLPQVQMQLKLLCLVWRSHSKHRVIVTFIVFKILGYSEISSRSTYPFPFCWKYIFSIFYSDKHCILHYFSKEMARNEIIRPKGKNKLFNPSEQLPSCICFPLSFASIIITFYIPCQFR